MTWPATCCCAITARSSLSAALRRLGDNDDGRITRVRLTADGERRLDRLASAHLDELQQLAPVLDQLVARWSSPDYA